jgi:aspartokinase
MKSIKYELVQEMAGMGAKVMHPYSILPCSVKNIPIKILNT